MPSDSKKREQARKKEAQKNRNKKIATVTGETNGTTNGTTNGVMTNGTNGAPVELTEEGMFEFVSYRFQMGNSTEASAF